MASRLKFPTAAPPVVRSTLKLAIVARAFPLVSQTFVLDHVTGLLGAGHSVNVFAAPPPSGIPFHGDFDTFNLSALSHYWPPQPVGRRAEIRELAMSASRASLLRTLPVLFRTQHFSRHDLRIARRRFSLASYLNQIAGNADIVHAHFGQQGEEMAWLKRCGALRARLVVSLHGYDVTRPLHRGLAPYPNLFRQADKILVTTHFMGRQAEAIGCPAEKLVRMPIGIRVEHFSFAERRLTPDEPTRLLTVGRLVEKKGIEYAVHAVARLAAMGADVQYTVVGDGPLRSSLQELASSLGIAHRVTFTGSLNREATQRHFADNHLFIFPSVTDSHGDQEGQGLVLAEAQACGLPVVATRIGGIPEGCKEGITAVLVPEKDAQALANGVIELIQRQTSWPEMGRAGRQLVEENYGFDTYLKRMVDIYHALLTNVGSVGGK